MKAAIILTGQPSFARSMQDVCGGSPCVRDFRSERFESVEIVC